MGKRVFVVCQPTRMEGGVPVATVDTSPAGKWGKLITVLKSSQGLISPKATIKTIHEMLFDFNDNDYIVPIGDPIVICAVAAIAGARNNGRIKFLKWDRRNNDYAVIQIDLNKGDSCGK